jgi:hypothetical protein
MAHHMTTHSDPLKVLASTRPVVDVSRYVHINRGALEALAPGLARSASETPTWNRRYHFVDGTERTANWLLALDALNFSFWGDPRWTVDYEGERLDGYWALAAALTRAVEEGFPIDDARFLEELSQKDAEHIFRGEGTLPLFDRRIENLQEVGRVLNDRWGGQYSRLIQASGYDAPRLVQMTVDSFPSFYDVADFSGRPVRFFKRAQLLAADLFGAFGGQSWGALHNLDQLTVFADYKLPQILRRLGILEYDRSLAEKVDHRFLLPAGSHEEIEIRAATVWAGEYMRQAMQSSVGADVPAYQIDWFLWNESQRLGSGSQPYHLTRTIYY